MKRLAKAKTKAEEKAAKGQVEQQQQKEAPAEAGKKKATMEDPSDPGEYLRLRVQMIEERRARGENPFPHKFDVTTSLTDFIERYEPLVTENGQVLEAVTLRVAGFYRHLIFSNLATFGKRKSIKIRSIICQKML